MSSQVLAIFQIGPVQEFISIAKRTQDFWSGSYLLSYLNCVAIDTVIQGTGGELDVIIFPALIGQNLFRYVNDIRHSGTTPWSRRPTPDELRPTVPNRFVARLDTESVAALLQQASQTVRTSFGEIATQVRSELLRRIQGCVPGFDRDVWDTIWARQTKDPFEIYWITHALDQTQYQQSYREAETLFGARKAIRNFQHQGSEPGYKCTLCGQREPLHAQLNGSLERGQLKTFWEQLRTATGHRFREGEHLCAVCTTKRLAPDYVFGRDHDIPSTSSVSVADFVQDLVTRYQGNPLAFQVNGIDLVKDFSQKAWSAAQQAGLGFRVEPLPKVKTAIRDPSLDRLVELDGDWFIEETYENLITRSPRGSSVNHSVVNEAKDALHGMIRRLSEVAKTSDSAMLGPGKYYAIFGMDGDDMGEHISKAPSIHDHQILSQALGDFSLRNAPAAVEAVHLGKAIYFGGDEGVAFVSLVDLLPTIDQCRKDFSTALGARNATACIGAVIAHHQQALLQVLSEVRRTIKMAKNLKDVDGRKDGFCLAIMRRSGSVTYARAHWEYNGFQVIPVLQELIGHYHYGRLSGKWWHQLSLEEWALKQVSGSVIVCNLDLASLEVARLLSRHVDREKMKNLAPTALDALIDRIQALLAHVQDWGDFMGLMEAATYIARGGGR